MSASSPAPTGASKPPPALRIDRLEAAGALGDLGTFIPLLAGMVSVCGLQLAPTLVTSGIVNIATGLAFGIPMPVQPMKAIAILAIDQRLTEAQILTAGIITGSVVLLLGVTGFIDWLNRRIPKSVVRGLQLALGLKLVIKATGMIAGGGPGLQWGPLLLGTGCTVLALLLGFSRRWPGALVVFVLGLAVLLVGQPQLLRDIRLGTQWTLPHLGNPADWRVGLLAGAIPQIPLTTLNSVISVCALSADLIPRRPAAPRRVAISVGLANLFCCPLGGMPVCHGAGGLASQYRFGARTGGSIVMLGTVKIALALLCGQSLLLWMQMYPQPVLGALLLVGGLELALVCRDQNARSDFFVMALTTGISLATNMALGFLAGWLAAMLLTLRLIRVEPPVDNSR